MANKVLAIVDATQLTQVEVQERFSSDDGAECPFAQLLRPFRNSSTVDQVVVAAAKVPEHDAIKQAAERDGFEIYRGPGPRSRMLDRFLRLLSPTTVVYIDGRQGAPTNLQVEGLLKFHFGSKNDVTSSAHVASFANGIDITVLSYRALAHVLAEASASGVMDPVPFELSAAAGLRVSSARQRRVPKAAAQAAL